MKHLSNHLSVPFQFAWLYLQCWKMAKHSFKILRCRQTTILKYVWPFFNIFMQGLTIIKCVILDKEVLKLSKFPAQAELIARITVCKCCFNYSQRLRMSCFFFSVHVNMPCVFQTDVLFILSKHFWCW